MGNEATKGKLIEEVLKAAGDADEAIDYFSMASAPDGAELIYVGQLGKDRAAAEAEIRKGVKDDRLVKALLVAWDAAQGSGPPTAPDVTKPGDSGTVKTVTRDDPPPTGSVDVTTSKWPVLTARFESETIQFRIPDILKNPPSDTHPVSFDRLEWSDWIHVARLCNLTKAIRLDTIYLGTGSILPDKVALRWRPQPGSGFVDGVTPHDLPGGGLSMNICFTAEEDSAFKQGVTAGSVTGGFWLVSATASASSKSKLATTSRKRRLYMALKDVHPTCRLHLRECVEASDEFKTAVTEALRGGDGPAFLALLELVAKFGHAVPENVVLGGVFVFENSKTVEKWERSREQELKSQLEVSFKAAAAGGGTGGTAPAPSAGSTVSYDDSGGDWMSQEHMAEHMRSYPVGGDMNLRNPVDWRTTVINPDDWRVILREGALVPVFDFLPADLKASVERVWDTGRKKAWGIDPARRTNKLPSALDFSVPLFWTAAGVQQVTLLNRSSKTVLQAKNDVRATVPAYPAPEVIPPQNYGGYHVGEQRCQIVPIEVPSPGRAGGSHWTHCDPAPRPLPEHMAADARESEALWRLEYSGDLTIKDEPLYWLVTQDDGWILAAFDDGRNQCTWASLWPAAHKGDLAGSSRAAWVVYPADPTGLRGPDFARTFLIWNPVVGGFLSGPKTLTGNKGWVEPEHTFEMVRAVTTSMGSMPYTHYEQKSEHHDRREYSDGTEEMSRLLLAKLPNGVDEVYDLPEDDFKNLWWDLKPYRN
ncbi:MAG: hypothetical protein U1E59_10230 [Amaricoccus sp.]